MITYETGAEDVTDSSASSDQLQNRLVMQEASQTSLKPQLQAEATYGCDAPRSARPGIVTNPVDMSKVQGIQRHWHVSPNLLCAQLLPGLPLLCYAAPGMATPAPSSPKAQHASSGRGLMA